MSTFYNSTSNDLEITPEQNNDFTDDDVLQTLTAGAVHNDVPANPLLRTDLIINKSSGDTVMIRTPESKSSFPLYKLEWTIAQLMDGKRNLIEISTEVTRRGLMANPDTVRSFIRELIGYRFLVTSNQSQLDGNRRDSSRLTQNTRESMSHEERHLYEMATARQARGDIEGATNYLLAMLEINPAHDTARALLRTLQQVPMHSQASTKLHGNFDQTLIEQNDNTQSSSDRFSRQPFFEQPDIRTKLTITRTVIIVAVTVLAAGTTSWLFKSPMTPSQSTATSTSAETTRSRTIQDENKKLATIRAIVQKSDPSLLTSTGKGIVFEIFVQPGQRIESGQEILSIITPADFKRLQTARKKYESLKQKSQKNPLARDFAEAAKQNLEMTRRTMKMTSIIATQSGMIERITLRPGDSIKKEQPFVAIDSATTLYAWIAKAEFNDWSKLCYVTSLSHSPVQALCHVDKTNVENQNKIRITIDNTALKLNAGQVVDINLQ